MATQHTKTLTNIVRPRLPRITYLLSENADMGVFIHRYEYMLANVGTIAIRKYAFKVEVKLLLFQ